MLSWAGRQREKIDLYPDELSQTTQMCFPAARNSHSDSVLPGALQSLCRLVGAKRQKGSAYPHLRGHALVTFPNPNDGICCPKIDFESDMLWFGHI
jgi:hypothetical protein